MYKEYPKVDNKSNLSLNFFMQDGAFCGTIKENGQGAYGIEVILWAQENEENYSRISAYDGSFSIKNIADGLYGIEIMSNLIEREFDIDVLIEGQRIKSIEAVNECYVHLENTSVSGIIYDLTGNPIVKKPVRIYKAEQNEISNNIYIPLKASLTNANGNYVFEHLDVGVYKISCKLD